jgi:hypothetical protein
MITEEILYKKTLEYGILFYIYKIMLEFLKNI